MQGIAREDRCERPDQAGAAFSLSNVSGTIAGNVIARNTCARGGGGALFDSTDENSVVLVSNGVDENVGDEPDTSDADSALTANETTGVDDEAGEDLVRSRPWRLRVREASDGGRCEPLGDGSARAAMFGSSFRHPGLT